MVFFSLLPYTTIFDAIVGLTEKRILGVPPHGKAQFAQALSPKSHSATHADHRMRLSVRSNVQNAPFREGADSECGFP